MIDYKRKQKAFFVPINTLEYKGQKLLDNGTKMVIKSSKTVAVQK